MNTTDIGAQLTLQIPEEIEGDSRWSLAVVTELNADGRSDFLWRNRVSGEVFISFRDDTGSVSFALDPAWEIVASGDFDADTLPEILLRHGITGGHALVIDLVGNPTLAPFPAVQERAWTSVSVADFDGDTTPDVLFVNRQTDDLLIWLLDDLAPAREVHLPAEMAGHQTLAGVGDFDQDGATDILRRNHTAGTVTVTRRLGEGGAQNVRIGPNVPREWVVAAAGDLDGNGSDDLVWRHATTGENVVWRIVDTQVADTASLRPVPDPHWAIQQ